MRRIFQQVELERTLIVASVITLTKTLVKPIQAGDSEVETIYRELLLTNERIRLVPVTAAIAETPAQIRARYNLRTPDALHLATAMKTNCDAFLTNDRNFRRTLDMRVLVLDDLEISPDSPTDET
jgi:predicted nucleic acid-binding protein